MIVVSKPPPIIINLRTCPGCGGGTTAPGRKTQQRVIVDDDGRTWHEGCAWAALGALTIYEEEEGS